MSPWPLAPVLDTFLRALPYTLRDTGADPGTQIQVAATGAAPMRWVTTRRDNRWFLGRGDAGRPAATVEMDGDTLWRLCTRNITPDDARARARAHGERRLAEQVLRIVSIVHAGR